MNRKTMTAVAAALAMGAAAWAFAADRSPMHGSGMQGMQGMQGMHPDGQGMMGGGCPMMGGGKMGAMGGGMMGGGMMPQLPPGNEKLQLQMWAEMMQKMGEIAGKYAAQLK